MKLIINISEEAYKMVQDNWLAVQAEGTIFENAVLNGTPLPKRHGRLIILSEDAVKREQKHFSFSWQDWISGVGLSNATVGIIEADKEGAE